jgi:hypothetical protein
VEVEGEDDDPDGDFREEVFDTIMLTVPFTFLFILLHVYVPFLSLLSRLPALPGGISLRYEY